MIKKIFLLRLTVIFCLVTNNFFAQTSTAFTQITLFNVVSSNGKDFIIDADYVQMLTGKAAINAAKKAGEAEYDINKKKDTVWYVPNDYFVVNSNKATRQLQLSSSAIIYLVKKGGSSLVKSTIARLQNNFKGRLFKIAIKNNEIIKIEEIYTP
jgi:hypothetical protein